MEIVIRLIRMQVCALLSIMMVLSTTSAVLAQTIDVSAPSINHSVVPSSTAGDNILIEAQVTDNVGVASVVVFYRFKGETSFQEIPMSPEGGDEYAALVPTVANVETDLEYYIEAADAGGTKTTRGLSFDPLTISIVKGIEEKPAENEAIEAPVLSESTPTESESSVLTETTPTETDAPIVPKPKSKKLWYVVGGVLLLGVAAAALGGGDDDDGGQPQACSDAGCSVTFNVTQP